jgi:uncharacterized protein YbjQ (UPF0145 family)
MLIVTTENIPGYKVEKVIGQVSGIVVHSRWVGSQFVAGLKSLVGGEIKGYTKMLEDARTQASERLSQKARDLGANAVIMMRYDANEIGGNMSEIVAYGTAVIISEAM